MGKDEEICTEYLSVKWVPCPRNPSKGFWFPESDRLLINKLSSVEAWDEQCIPVFQRLIQQTAFLKCKNYGVALDIGAHVGLWSKRMAPLFSQVFAFEPIREHYECFKKNVSYPNVMLSQYALGSEEKLVRIGGPIGSKSFVQGDGKIPMRRLDSFVWIKPIDFIKIDVEDYELFVLKGAERTIKRDYPVICLEQIEYRKNHFGHKNTAGVDLLQEWGYRVIDHVDTDYIMEH